LREWVEAVAEATQTPADLAAMLALAVTAAAIAGKFRALVRDGWTEPANLFTVVALPPGDRKSAVFAEAIRPVQRFEAEELERMRPVIAEAASEHRMLEGKLKHAEAKVAKAGDNVKEQEFKQEARRLAKELAAHTVPEEPRFYCDDVTPEKLGNLLARQGGRILQASAEGTAFEIAKGRYNETANFDIYLKAHAGDPLRSDRVSRENDTVENPALSLALAVQPDVIRGLAGQASMRGRGFLARFLYAIPVSRVGSRNIRPRPVAKVVANRYEEAVMKLWGLPGHVDEHGKQAPHLVLFSTGADAAVACFQQWIEPQLAEGEDLSYLAGWANKLAGAVARIALVLHMATAVGEERSWQTPISVEVAQAAIEIGKGYLLKHAKAAFGLMGADEQVTAAMEIVARLPRICESFEGSEQGGTISRRDVHQAFRVRFKSVEALDPVLTLLVENEYLRPIRPDKNTQAGRPPSPRFEINPAVLQTRNEKAPLPAQNTHNAQNSDTDPDSEISEVSESGAASALECPWREGE
jgi:hypothetical protein